MADRINETADWEPGTLDKTRKNIGENLVARFFTSEPQTVPALLLHQ